jgi:hypothetical protein
MSCQYQIWNSELVLPVPEPTFVPTHHTPAASLGAHVPRQRVEFILKFNQLGAEKPEAICYPVASSCLIHISVLGPGEQSVLVLLLQGLGDTSQFPCDV